MSGDTIFISLTISMIIGTGAMLTAFVGMRRARIELERSRRDFGELKPLLVEMQHTLETVSLEVERLGEAQRFTAQLQIERAETLRALQHGGSRSIRVEAADAACGPVAHCDTGTAKRTGWYVP